MTLAKRWKVFLFTMKSKEIFGKHLLDIAFLFGLSIKDTGCSKSTDASLFRACKLKNSEKYIFCRVRSSEKALKRKKKINKPAKLRNVQ